MKVTNRKKSKKFFLLFVKASRETLFKLKLVISQQKQKRPRSCFGCLFTALKLEVAKEENDAFTTGKNKFKGRDQCDQIGRFLNFLVTNFLTKVAQLFWYIFGLFLIIKLSC